MAVGILLDWAQRLGELPPLHREGGPQRPGRACPLGQDHRPGEHTKAKWPTLRGAPVARALEEQGRRCVSLQLGCRSV